MQIELIALDLFSLTHLSSQTGHFWSPHPIDSKLLFSRGKASSQPLVSGISVFAAAVPNSPQSPCWQ